MTNPSPECDHRSTEKGWRDIASAPKDGAEIIGIYYRPGDDDFKPVTYGPWTIAFRRNEWQSSWDGSRVISSEGDFGAEYKEPDCYPTHWQPLPSPPAHQENSPRSAPEPDKYDVLGSPNEHVDVPRPDTEPAPQVRKALRLTDPKVIIAGIRQFGLAPDGSDLRDLETAIAALTAERPSDTDPISLRRQSAEELARERPVAQVREAAREPIQASTEQVHGKGDQLSMERAAVSDAMIDAALNAWFKSPPSESDMGLERSMGAALEAASLIANQNDLRGSQPETVAREPVGLARVQAAADDVVSRVAEYDDRTSPDDFLEALLITPSELHQELVRFAEDIDALTSPPPASAVREALEQISTVCTDNLDAAKSEYRMALQFVRQIAVAALSIKGTDLKQADETSKQKLADPSC